MHFVCLTNQRTKKKQTIYNIIIGCLFFTLDSFRKISKKNKRSKKKKYKQQKLFVFVDHRQYSLSICMEYFVLCAIQSDRINVVKTVNEKHRHTHTNECTHSRPIPLKTALYMRCKMRANVLNYVINE